MATGGQPADYKCNQERTNYARLCRAIVDLCSHVLRDVLIKEIPSNQIFQKAKACSNLKLNPSQRGILQAASSSGYKDFDISLLYTLIRNLCPGVQPTNGWTHGYPPKPVEVTDGDDIERIHFIRNNIYGHLSNASISDSKFKDYWLILQGIMKRMDVRLGENYTQALTVIETDNMDEANEKIYMEQIKELQNTEKDLQTKVEKIERHVFATAAQHEIIQRWESHDVTFVETRATTKILELVRSKQFIAVSGVPGSGKSASVHHIALRMQQEGYCIVPVYTCDEILKYWSVDGSQVFVFDDPFGVHNLDEVEYNNWSRRIESLKGCLKNNKIFVSVRTHLTKERRVNGICKQLEAETVDICEGKLSLTREEQTKIFQSHMDHNRKNHSDIIVPTCNLPLFPLLCQIFSAANSCSDIKAEIFFKKPLSVLRTQILHFRDNDKMKYFCLVFCLVYDGQLPETILRVGEEEREKKTKRKTFLDLCCLPKSTSNMEIKHHLETLEGTYIIKSGNNYTFLHDVIYDTVVSSLSSYFHVSVLKHCSSSFIRKRVTFPEIVKTDSTEDMVHPYVMLNADAITFWRERLVADVKDGKIVDVVLNSCLKLQKYESFIVDTLKRNRNSLDIGCLMCKQITNVVDEENKDSCNSFAYEHLIPLHLMIEEKLEQLFLYSWNEMSFSTKHDFLSSYKLICSAAESGSESILKVLIRDGANVNSVDDFNRSPLFYAAKQGHEDIVQLLIDKGASVYQFDKKVFVDTYVNHCDKFNRTPLFGASEEGHEKVVQMLIDNGADVNHCDKYQQAPLFCASESGFEKVIKILVDRGADVNQRDIYKQSPLMCASDGGYDKIVQILVDKGACVNQYDVVQRTPLACASIGGHDKIVQILVDKGADINQYENQRSPLLCASERGYDKVVKILVDKGANVNQLDETRRTPLLCASERGYDNVVKVLADKGADINIHDKDQRSPLLCASERGHEKVVKILVGKGAEVNQCDIYHRDPLLRASKKKCDKVVQILVENGADVNLLDYFNQTPLLFASKKRHEKIVQLLVDKDADVNQCEGNKRSPLLWASRRGHYKTAQILVDKGADVNHFDKYQQFPLLCASIRGYEKIVQLLIEKGANVNQYDKFKRTSLLWASKRGHDKIVQILVDNGADVNNCDKYQQSSLFCASKGGDENVVHMLLDKGADVNLYDKDQRTPLLCASEEGHDKIVQLLIDKGADVNLCDKDKRSPFICASDRGHHQVVQLLVDKGADINHYGRDKCEGISKSVETIGS